jgi:hypothetical protein
MCVYGHMSKKSRIGRHLFFIIGKTGNSRSLNYLTLIFDSDHINFYTEFGKPFLLFNQQQCFIYSTASFLSKLRAKKVEKLCNSS